MTMPRVVCPSPVSSVDGNQSIGTLTHAGCRNTVVFSSASGGAGTSVFAAMVAWRLAQRKLQCALVDCDFAAGGIDVLLGIENEPGLRFQTVDIPLGKTEGAALNGELPQWERVGVLASQPWNGSDPEPWTVSAVLEALAQANDVVVVDIGAPSALHSLPMLRQCRQVVLAELTVLGLARARAARAMMIRQGESRPADCRAAAAWSTRTRHRSICMRSWPGWWLRTAGCMAMCWRGWASGLSARAAARRWMQSSVSSRRGWEVMSHD